MLVKKGVLPQTQLGTRWLQVGIKFYKKEHSKNDYQALMPLTAFCGINGGRHYCFMFPLTPLACSLNITEKGTA